MPSRQIPQRTVDVLRQHVDVVMLAIGIPCTLYIPTEASYSVAEKKDIFSTPSDYEYTPYSANMWIEWNPSTYRLKKLGLFTEESLPILVWFGNVATNLSGNVVSIDIVQHSYFKLDAQYIPGSFTEAEEFEIVNIGARAMHDAMVLKSFSAAPRRKQV